jgi:CspA family cold shock protein
MDGTIATGRVSWFNQEKQFGFVKLDDGLGDAFLHMEALKAGGYYFVPRGTTVQVRVEPDRGKHRVVEVLNVDASTARYGEPPPQPRKQTRPDGPLPAQDQGAETSMNTDQWRKKREALIGQLRDLETGRISHWDEGGDGELNRHTTDESIERVKQRLANLDAKFQDQSGS